VKRYQLLGALPLSIGLVCLATACQRKAAVDSRAKDKRSIRAADADCLKAFEAKDAERAAACYTDDASLLPPNLPPVQGRPGIRATWSAFLATPAFAIDWHFTKMEVAAAGDLAFTVYGYEMNMQGPDGTPLRDQGKDLAFWKKQNGKWKMAADTFNSDLPLPAPAKTK